MYELVQVAENSFYMDCPAKVGFFYLGNNKVVAIDSGSDKDAGKKVKKIIDTQGWKLKAIYITHSHADHIGGNQYLQNQTGCRIFAPGIEHAFAEFPILEPAMLYGGYPMKELQTKFLMAKESTVERLTPETLPEGMEIIELPGHSYHMVGFRTKDDVVFLADALSSHETLEKYQIGFLYDVGTYISTLEKVKELSAKAFVPSHAPVTDNIVPLAQENIDKSLEIAGRILSYLEEPIGFDDLLAKVFSGYNLVMNVQQKLLVGSSVNCYLSYLRDKGQAEYIFEENKMLWKRV